MATSALPGLATAAAPSPPLPSTSRFDCGSEGNCWSAGHQQRFAPRHSRHLAACRLRPAWEPVRRLGYALGVSRDRTCPVLAAWAPRRVPVRRGLYLATGWHRPRWCTSCHYRPSALPAT